MESEAPKPQASLEQVVRGLCLGILGVVGFMSVTVLMDERGLGSRPPALIAAGLQLLLLGWMWLYRWGREGLRWQFACGYVGMVTLAFNMFAKAFLGGASGPLWMIGVAGVAYGLIPLVRRDEDAALEDLSPNAPLPYAKEPGTGQGAFELRMQAQVLAFTLLLGWALIVITRLQGFTHLLGRREGAILSCYLWMVIGGSWCFSMGRRGVTPKSLAAAVLSAFLAGNLFLSAFYGRGFWPVTLVALLVNLAALVQWLPNRGMDVLPDSPRVGEWPKPFDTADSHAAHGHH